MDTFPGKITRFTAKFLPDYRFDANKTEPGITAIRKPNVRRVLSFFAALFRYLSLALQVWHWCLPNGQKFSFLCPNGTVFNQIARVCDWWFNVDCASTPNYYGINEDLYIVPPPYNRRRD